MQFRLLGPLEVEDGDRMLDISRPQQRALLAMLLLNANRVVSTDSLVDALWEEHAPDTATKALQVHVSQLRRLLGSTRLQTKAPGYLLQVGDGLLPGNGRVNERRRGVPGLVAVMACVATSSAQASHRVRYGIQDDAWLEFERLITEPPLTRRWRRSRFAHVGRVGLRRRHPHGVVEGSSSPRPVAKSHSPVN